MTPPAASRAALRYRSIRSLKVWTTSVTATKGKNTENTVTALIWTMITMATSRNRRWATRMSKSSTFMRACLGSSRKRLTASPGDAGRERSPLSSRTWSNAFLCSRAAKVNRLNRHSNSSPMNVTEYPKARATRIAQSAQTPREAPASPVRVSNTSRCTNATVCSMTTIVTTALAT